MHLLIVYVPVSHSEAVRKALVDSGAGKLGNYDSCSFSCKGIGRFRPLKGSDPAIGSIGKLEEVEEERIEVLLPNEVDPETVVDTLKKAHPYEEPAISILRLS